VVRGAGVVVPSARYERSGVSTRALDAREREWHSGSARVLRELGARRRVDREEALDVAVLAWIARFAFVTATTAAERWRVSEQRMRSRGRGGWSATGGCGGFGMVRMSRRRSRAARPDHLASIHRRA